MDVAGESITNKFSQGMIRRVVDATFGAAGASATIPINPATSARFPDVDANRDGKVNRSELEAALYKDTVSLSLRGLDGPDLKLAKEVAAQIDGEDGKQDGKIRLYHQGALLGVATVDKAAKELGAGTWVLGASGRLGTADNVLEIRKGPDGPNLTGLK